MIGVFVRVQHGVDGADSGGHQLQPQFGRRVDQHAGAVIGVDDDGTPGALVARVGGPTDDAVAPDLRYAEAGARAQKPQTHAGLSPRSRA